MEWFHKSLPNPFKRDGDKGRFPEPIPTHGYGIKGSFPRLFMRLPALRFVHDLIQEGDVIEKLQTQWQSGQNLYDAYINDSDLIGTHWRYNFVVNLTDWMAGQPRM